MSVSRWKVAAVMAAVVMFTAAVVTSLWWAGTRGLDGKDLVTARLDALKTGLSIGVGGAGLYALYLAWRRQRSTEADLDNRERALAHQQQVAAETKAHQERIAAATESDAEARRITDLYTKAAEQLGSDKAPVRLAGLYAFERLAQDHVDQRQTIVNVLCAYLRMPYTPPSDPPSEDDVERTQEREVRLAAQRVLFDHLHPAVLPAARFWREIDLDLTSATLIDFRLAECVVRSARFTRTTFVGSATFSDAEFSGDVSFDKAQFIAHAYFMNAQFKGSADFAWARFRATAWFNNSQFSASRRPDGALARTGGARFEGAQFDYVAAFNEAQFGSRPDFDNASFRGEVPDEVKAFVRPKYP